MTDTPIERLKGCPFCGLRTAYCQDGDLLDGTTMFIWCAKCGGRSRECVSEEEAIAAWNTRATIEPIPSAGEGERVERLRETIVELWHETEAAREPLHHYLDMTEAEYAAWAVLATLPSEPPTGRVEIQVGDPDYERFNLRPSEECTQRLARKPSPDRLDCVIGAPSEPLRDD